MIGGFDISLLDTGLYLIFLLGRGSKMFLDCTIISNFEGLKVLEGGFKTGESSKHSSFVFSSSLS